MVSENFKISKGLAAELLVKDASEEIARRRIDSAPDFDSWVAASGKIGVVRDTQFHSRLWREGARVLDVGFGGGYSSLQLSASRFDVTGVEPSSSNIRIAQMAAKKFGHPIKTECCTGEEMGKLDIGPFDVVLFNSSLHHCDDPLAALKNAYNLVVRGGEICLVEPALKPWRTKVWYDRQLIENPIKLGHYGGNEHIYYNWEYQKLLSDTGFSDIRFLPQLITADLRERIAEKASQKINDEYVFSAFQVGLRAIYYSALNQVGNNRLVSGLMRHLSLGDGIWKARKSD